MTETLAAVDALAEPLRSRWSPAVFATDVPVDDATLAAVLTAAGWAPSTGNSQPWSFVVTRHGTPEHQVVVDALTRGNAGWVPTAPVVVVAATLTDAWEDRKPMGDYALYDLGQSVAHLTLQAQAMGLHSHQFAGFDHAAVAEGLGIPEQYRVMVGVALGYVGTDAHLDAADDDLRARHHRERARRTVGEVAYDGRFGAPFEA